MRIHFFTVTFVHHPSTCGQAMRIDFVISKRRSPCSQRRSRKRLPLVASSTKSIVLPVHHLTLARRCPAWSNAVLCRRRDARNRRLRLHRPIPSVDRARRYLVSRPTADGSFYDKEAREVRVMREPTGKNVTGEIADAVDTRMRTTNSTGRSRRGRCVRGRVRISCAS